MQEWNEKESKLIGLTCNDSWVHRCNDEIADELKFDSDSNEEKGNENRSSEAKGKEQADDNKVIERSQWKLMTDTLNEDPRVLARKTKLRCRLLGLFLFSNTSKGG